MKTSTVLSIACLLVCLVAAASSEVTWEQYKQHFGKEYSSLVENLRRRANFESEKERLNKVFEEHGDRGYTQGYNNLSDWSEEEKARLNGFRPALLKFDLWTSVMRTISEDAIRNVTVPDRFDWREVPGRVSDVKNQGRCGSCWAFAATGALESVQAYAGRTGIIDLSEQNLIDCSSENLGCDGGLPSLAFDFIKKQGGIVDDESYPYVGAKGECRFKKEKVVTKDNGHFRLESGSEDLLKSVVARYGPVSVGIQVTPDFFSYAGGVFDDPTCSANEESLNHAVLVIGYGTDEKFGDYWLVKNSWGKNWGEEGYVRMSRNKRNQCGIATMATIPSPVWENPALMIFRQ